MKHNIPDWAKQNVTPNEHHFSEVSQLHHQGKAQIQLPDLQELKNWAKTHGWPNPWFGFKNAFITKLFENQETFTQALNHSGIHILIPIKEHTLTVEMVQELDGLYEKREDRGVLGQRPVDWGILVGELREIRHLVEAGIKVKIEGTQTVLSSWQRFYSWAHGRYHMLEDGYDSWIGDDKS